MLAPRPTPKLEYYPLSAVHNCVFDIFAATLHIGGPSSIRNQRTRHAVVTGTHSYIAAVPRAVALPTSACFPLFLCSRRSILFNRMVSVIIVQ